MTNQVAVKPRRRKNASLDKRKARGGWIFVLPFLIGFLLIYLPIIVDSLRLTFIVRSFDTTTQEMVDQWVWFQNYAAAFEEGDFTETLVLGLQNMAFDIPMILMFSLFMAVLLNQKMAGRAAFRAIFFIPVILYAGVLEGILSSANLESASNAGIESGSGEETTTEGIVNSMDIQKLFGTMAVGTELVEYVTQAINNIYNIANRSGVQMLIFLSGLQSISPAIYESVQIDGASAWETFWKITFPMISPMILVNAVYTVIDSFTAQSNVVMSYISKFRGTGGDAQFVSSAMSWVYFLIVIVIIAIVAAVFSAFVFYQRRD